MNRLNAALLLAGAACLVLAGFLVDVRLGLALLGIFLIAATLERP